jgi:fructokinase
MFVVGGESLIDLVSKPVGEDGRIELVAHAGGSPYNCAIALSKLGNETGFLCPISEDTFGGTLLRPLEAAGVEPLIRERVRAPTTLAVVTLNERGEASYAFYRQADRAFSSEVLLSSLPKEIELFQIGGFCAIEPEDAEAWLGVAAEAARRGATISMDPNVRPSLVGDLDAYKARLGRLLDIAHVIKVSREDLAALDSGRSLEQHAEELLGRPNCELVVVTLGDEGSRAFTARAQAEAGIYTPPTFVDTVGAGDTLMAAVLTFLCERNQLKPGELANIGPETLQKMLQFGAVAAGINCGRAGADPPNRGEVDVVLTTLAMPSK